MQFVHFMKAILFFQTIQSSFTSNSDLLNYILSNFPYFDSWMKMQQSKNITKPNQQSCKLLPTNDKWWWALTSPATDKAANRTRPASGRYSKNSRHPQKRSNCSINMSTRRLPNSWLSDYLRQILRPPSKKRKWPILRRRKNRRKLGRSQGLRAS